MDLHHYTDVNGLASIIQNEMLWATDMGFLNDSQEMLAGIALIKKECNNINYNKIFNKSVESAIREFYKQIPGFVEENIKKRNNYIVSFSEAGDNLRQWMSYCPKNAGYSIEFDSRKVLIDRSIGRERKVVCQLMNVDYHEKKIKEILKLENIIEIVRNGLPAEEKIIKLANDLFFNSCAVKPKEFYDEQETRLVIQSRLEKNHDVKFRTRGGVIIPYFEYPIKHSWIKEITIGPNVNMSLARKGLETFLEKYSITCEIRESKCSLRNF